MIRIRPSIQRSVRQPPWWLRAAPLLCLWPHLAAAQPVAPPADEQRQQIRIAADERTLWLAVVRGSQSRVFYREAGGEFDLGRSSNQRIGAMTALDRTLLVFFEDDAPYRYFPDQAFPKVEAVLPQSALPLDVVGERGLVYAIIPSPAAEELPSTPADGAAPASQPYDAGGAPLSLAIYGGRSWTAAAPLPPLVRPSTDARLRPRLCVDRGKLLLFSPVERPDHILYFYRDVENSQWVSRGTIGVPGLTGFWTVIFSRVPTLVTVSQSPAGGEKLSAFRLLGDAAEADASSWRPADDLKLSELPEGVTVARYTEAVGFNQHLGLAAIGTNGEAYLRFARIVNPPAEPTVLVADVLTEPGTMHLSGGLAQMFTFILLLGVLIGLFVFRRGSMVNLIDLPPGCALALNLQRMLGWLIDFVPFALAAAKMLDVSCSDGLRALFKWGISPDPEGGVPEQSVFAWWALSVLGYTAYMLLMELLVRRTVGKVVTRVYLLSESGTRPTAWQIVTRNLTRLIEFMPQFWIFVVLVLLSRNRQRIGDIFARTVAIRLTPHRPASTGQKSAGSSDEGLSEPPDDDTTPRRDSDEPD